MKTPTRKELRKQQRKEKKVKKSEWFSKSKKQGEAVISKPKIEDIPKKKEKGNKPVVQANIKVSLLYFTLNIV